jgi:hypothetical protein
MTLTEEGREALINERVEAHDPANQPTLRLPWRGGSQEFPVIKIELDAVVLNPYSHRIRAQLESHPQGASVRTEPFSEASQRLIAEILPETGENFDDLKRNLHEEGQLQFGVITRKGLLVNANRRAVALRELGKTYIEVAVLPPDTTTLEINDLELTLQVQRTFWEAYTFTNRLLFVDELITDLGRPAEEVARALNPAVARDARSMKRGKDEVEKDTRVLSLLREIQDRSDQNIPLTSFDEQEVALEELETKLNDGASENPEATAALFEVRLLGILANVPYRRLRQLDGDVIEDYVIPALGESEILAEVLPALPKEQDQPEIDKEGEPDGLEVLGEEDEDAAEQPLETEGTAKIRSLATILATSFGEDEVELPLESGTRREERTAFIETLNGALVAAAVEIEADRRHDNRLDRRVQWLREAERKLRSAGEAYEAVCDEGGFDADAYREALERAEKRLNALREDLDAAD